ncbi:FAD-dependent oxidoreductase, partial [Candidatus Pelagibacter sp.]|nr:FAD-dependent oxidoreductase [Candidatus Pelagibacter sp.]
GGNVGRNTTIIRSNYMHDDNALFSEFGMDLWRRMSQDLNYNVMFSPRGIINLAHSDAQMNTYARRGNSMRLNGIDAVLLNREEVKEIIPMADFSENVRFPIFGGLMQPSAGTARHDAVAWGYARQADDMGVDIIQNCEVIGFDVSAGKINGVRTSRGDIKAKKIGLCVAGSTNILAEKLNMTLPIETHLLQACVSEPVKPVLDKVVTFGAGHFYISQSDKGEMVMGGDLDGYNSYAQRGNLPTLQHVLTEGIAMMPFLSKLKMLRTWGGIMDMSMDGSPIIDKTHIEGLYLNCGWCYGGFKATPASGWTFAHTIAQDRVHQLNADGKQKISLGRGLARSDVNVIMFDEPLTVIDPHLKWVLRSKLKELHQKIKRTMIYVTHDQTEALTFADQVVVMHEGQIVQTGTPVELFEKPKHTFVGHFIGSPGMNILPCKIDNGLVFVDNTNIEISNSKLNNTSYSKVELGIRPEFISFDKKGLPVKVTNVSHTGKNNIIETESDGGKIKLITKASEKIPEGPTFLTFKKDYTYVYKDDWIVE